MHLCGTHVAAVDHVEKLKEDKSIPDQGEVKHLVLSIFIVLNRLGRGWVGYVTKDSTSAIHNHHHDHSLEDYSSENLAVHEGSHELFLASSVLGNVG